MKECEGCMNEHDCPCPKSGLDVWPCWRPRDEYLSELKQRMSMMSLSDVLVLSHSECQRILKGMP